jgi:hypothetical protein
MPRFFFHLDNNPRIQDDEGEEFLTVKDAQQHARRVAWELVRNATPGAKIGSAVILADDGGRELLTISLDQATEPP